LKFRPANLLCKFRKAKICKLGGPARFLGAGMIPCMLATIEAAWFSP